MYSGLFGDLPSAKKQKTANGGDDSDNKNNSGTNNNKGKSNELSKTERGGDAATVAKGNWFAPPKQAAQKAKAKNKSQFLQMVGKSGTTMAFVPAAALKSKRKKVPVAGSNTNNNTNANNTTTTEKDDITKKVVSLATTNSSTHKQQESSFAAVTTTIVTTRIASSKPDPTKAIAVVDIHGYGDAIGGGVTESNNDNDENNTPITLSLDAFDDATAAAAADKNNYTEEQVINDPYDPFVPNDLLEYWETLAAKKHREKLERDTREALERQKAMRKQLDLLSGSNNTNTNHSRDKNEIDIGNDMNGDGVTGSVHLIPPIGRGRGRGGLSNLPAWLVEKQRKEQQLGGGGAGVSTLGTSVNTNASSPGRGRGPRGVSNLPAWLVEKQRKEAAAAANGQ